MNRYRLEVDGVVDTTTSGSIPADVNNLHYVKYLKWVAEGNTPDPVVEPYALSDEDKLNDSDQKMVRAVDWLLQYLVKNGVIPVTDIPAPLKALYLERKAQRGA